LYIFILVVCDFLTVILSEMKKIILLTGVVILSLFTSRVFAQDKCKVLMTEISGSYNGSCKKGLADGPGEAIGIDRYKGEFKKGLPNGVGTYIWHTDQAYSGEWKRGLRDGKGKYTIKYMGRDSTISGIWREDKYIGQQELKPYVIEYRNSIGRVTCMKIGDRPYIKYIFSRNGGASNNINNLLLQGSSGSESNTTAFTGFEQVTFPFNGKVTFTAPNSFMTSILYCELRLVINESGSWIVTMFY
jgi:hypothetical protein